MRGYAVMQDGTRKIVQLSMPRYNQYQALVKTDACGVCNGTDIKIAHQNFKNFSTYPALLGHEAVATVVETGAKVRNLKKGDRVILPFVEGVHDGYYSGFGSYCEYGVVGDCKALFDDGLGEKDENFSLSYYAQQKLPPEIDPVEATLIVTFREVLSAIRRFGFKPDTDVVIFGGGAVGLSFVRILKLLGIKNVMLFEIDDKKAARAGAFGADYAYNSQKVDVVQAVRDAIPQGVDMVVDAVGVPELINTGMRLIKDAGKICCYGISPQLGMQLDWSGAPYNWQIDFVQFPYKIEEAEAHTQVINWLQCGALKAADFVGHVMHFDDIDKAFELIEKGHTDLKTVIKYS